MSNAAPIELTWPELRALMTLAIQRIGQMPMPPLRESDEEALIDFTRKAAVVIGETTPGGPLVVEANDGNVTVKPISTGPE